MCITFDNKPKLLINYLLIFLFIGIYSCASKEKATKTNQEETAQDEPTIDQNMKAATLVDYSERDSTCSLLLVLEDGNVLQPLQIDNEYRKDGIKVWIDFSYSKRKQGPCSFGTPIVINKITKRLE